MAETEAQKLTFRENVRRKFKFSRNKLDKDREAEAKRALDKLGADRLYTSSHSTIVSAVAAEDKPEPKWKKYLKVNLTILAIILAVVVAVLLRLREDKYSRREVMYLSFIGTLYLRILQGLAAPLLIVSVLSSLGRLNLRMAGIIGLRAFIYFMLTTAIAIAIGIVLTFTIRPGDNFKTETTKATHQVRDTTVIDSVLDLIRNAFPSNLVQAMVLVDRTDLKRPEPICKNKTINNETVCVPDKKKPIPDKSEWDFSVDPAVKGTNFLGLIISAIVISLFIGMKDRGDRILITLIENLNDILILILQTSLWIMPPGVFFLVVGKIVEMEDWSIFFGQVGMFTVTVIAALSIHLLVVLPIIYFVFTRKLPFKFFFNLIEAMLTAFATSSSLATLPVTLDCVERKNKIPVIVARFVVTLGATVNMDGTALYQAAAPLFIAQVRKIQVPFLELLLMSVTALLASVGAAGIPQASLVIMVIVFDIIGIDPEDISYIILVDWFLDRLRTLTNVTSDSVGAAVVYELSKKKLKQFQEEEERTGEPQEIHYLQ